MALHGEQHVRELQRVELDAVQTPVEDLQIAAVAVLVHDDRDVLRHEQRTAETDEGEHRRRRPPGSRRGSQEQRDDDTDDTEEHGVVQAGGDREQRDESRAQRGGLPCPLQPDPRPP